MPIREFIEDRSVIFNEELSPENCRYTQLHRGMFCLFPFWWIYYYHSPGKETGKMHLLHSLEQKHVSVSDTPCY